MNPTPDTTTGLRFLGAKLHRFTPRRQSIASEMGMKFGNVPVEDTIKLTVKIPAEGKGAKKKAATEIEVTTYKGVDRDARLIVWLCLQPESTIAGIEEGGKRGLTDAKSDMWKWAEKAALNIGTPNQELVQELFWTIMGQIFQERSTPVPKHEAGEAGENEPPD